MSGPHKRLTAGALDSIRGAWEAQQAIHDIRTGRTHPDRLLKAMRTVFLSGNEWAVPGFLGGLPKAVERTT